MPADALFSLGANLDLRFQGTGTQPLSDVILDYMYGVAAFKCWGVEASREMLQKYYESHYKSVLLAAPNPHSGEAGSDSGGDGDDPRDADYVLNASQQHHSSISRDTEMNAFIMALQGTSQEDAAKRWEKRMDEEGRIAQQASPNKVMEWMRTVEVGGS